MIARMAEDAWRIHNILKRTKHPKRHRKLVAKMDALVLALIESEVEILMAHAQSVEALDRPCLPSCSSASRF